MKRTAYFLIPITFAACCEPCDEVSSTEEVVVEEATVEEAFETVEFPSLDSLTITGRLYEVKDHRQVILLCHQARFNKAEYESIAPSLQEMGYTCLAIDQRSGGPIIEERNETYLRALEQTKPTDYLDAEQDITASIDWLTSKYDQPIVLWGSSYSSTLSCYHGVENENVKAHISFSPGNYFKDVRGDLNELLSKHEKPFFLTCSKSEAPMVDELVKDKQLNEKQIYFLPESEGAHGSRCLWTSQPFHKEYWNAITDFLNGL